jgi:hypothetical protein
MGQMDDITINLANALAFFDGDAGIPLSILSRAGAPLRIWDTNGEPKDVTPTEAAIEPELAFILCDPERLQLAINQLKFHCLLNVDSNDKVLRMHACTRAMHQQSMLDPDRWMLQAVLLVCHAFPMDAYLESE